jgi:steroid delta-isomerase-like uncharacterized protein
LSTVQGKSIIHRVFDEAFSQGNIAIVDELMAPESVSHHFSLGMPANRMGFKQMIAMFRTAFPDLICTVEGEIKQDDKVAARWTMRGTHKGPFLGNTPTGKSIMVRGLIYARIENNHVIESWILIDQLGVLQQLGLVPPPLPPLSRTTAEP